MAANPLVRRLESLQARNVFSQPSLSSASSGLRDPAFTASAGAILQPSSRDNGDTARIRDLERQLGELKCQLAEEMMSKAMALEETQHLRQRLLSSEEALIQFAERARSDREEVARKRFRSHSDSALSSLQGHQDEPQ
jgi:hypothetical protein